MNYSPKENELILGVPTIVGGSFTESGSVLLHDQLETKEVLVSIHNSNIWIEIPGVIGMSFDKDIILAIMEKIIPKKQNNFVININEFVSKKDISLPKDEVKEELTKILLNAVNNSQIKD